MTNCNFRKYLLSGTALGYIGGVIDGWHDSIASIRFHPFQFILIWTFFIFLFCLGFFIDIKFKKALPIKFLLPFTLFSVFLLWRPNGALQVVFLWGNNEYYLYLGVGLVFGLLVLTIAKLSLFLKNIITRIDLRLASHAILFLGYSVAIVSATLVLTFADATKVQGIRMITSPDLNYLIKALTANALLSAAIFVGCGLHSNLRSFAERVMLSALLGLMAVHISKITVNEQSLLLSLGLNIWTEFIIGGMSLSLSSIVQGDLIGGYLIGGFSAICIMLFSKGNIHNIKTIFNKGLSIKKRLMLYLRYMKEDILNPSKLFGYAIGLSVIIASSFVLDLDTLKALASFFAAVSSGVIFGRRILSKHNLLK